MSNLAFDNVATLLLLLVSLMMIYLTASGTRTRSHDSFIWTSKEAFDTVDHNIFLLKLKAAGVSAGNSIKLVSILSGFSLRKDL